MQRCAVDETAAVRSCAVAPLEGFAKTDWVCFERALVVRDTFNGGTRTFLNQEDARLFRRTIYEQVSDPWVRPTGRRGAGGLLPSVAAALAGRLLQDWMIPDRWVLFPPVMVSCRQAGRCCCAWLLCAAALVRFCGQPLC